MLNTFTLPKLAKWFLRYQQKTVVCPLYSISVTVANVYKSSKSHFVQNTLRNSHAKFHPNPSVVSEKMEIVKDDDNDYERQLMGCYELRLLTNMRMSNISEADG